MNITININKRFVNQAKVMLYSLAKYNRGNFKIYVLHHDLEDVDFRSIKSCLEDHYSGRFDIIDCKVQQIDFKKYFSSESRWPSTVYYRLLAPFILPEDVERVLYLDCDMVIVADITSLYTASFGDNYIICSEDNEANETKEVHKRLDLPLQQIYVNSGMILFNVNKIRNSFRRDDLFDLIAAVQDKLFFPDQDVLNIMYSSKIGVVPSCKFNYICIPNRYKKINHDEVVIYHFGGEKEYKPWNKIYIGKYDSIYWDCAAEILGCDEFELFKKGRHYWKIYGYIYHIFKHFGRRAKTSIKRLCN